MQSTLSQQPGVAIILLNYHGADDTIACVESLKCLEYENYRIIIVDNASQDDSISKISKALRDIELIQSPTNLGFSGGNNLGIQKALEDPGIRYIWILNNDTTTDSKALTALVHKAELHPKALIGSLILYPDGRFQNIGTRFFGPFASLKAYGEKEVIDGQEVESLSGCSMLIPRFVFESIGLWDEDYFLYFEDNDFCLKATKAGFHCLITTESMVYHHKNASTGKNPPLVTYYYQRNRLLLAKKHFKACQRNFIQLYTCFRLWRSELKAKRKNTPEAHQHHLAFKLAVQDFFAGAFGKCSHSI